MIKMKDLIKQQGDIIRKQTGMKINEKTLWFDEETSQVSKLEGEIDGFIANGKYKNLLKHDDPKVKQWIKQVIPMLKKSQGLLGKIYNEILGT